MSHTNHMEGLVNNALDFVEKAFQEFLPAPKYSVIHLYAGVELFLKARLLAEHWALVIAKPQEADLAKFLKGDFQSVTLDDAAKRLDKIVGSGLTPAEVEQVRSLGRHRNQMMHFYHDATGPAGEALRREVAVEQLRAWHTLNRLLLDRWEDVFKPWAHRISQLDEALKGHRDYLQVRFDALKPELSAKEMAGARLTVCTSCGHRADELMGLFGALSSGQCHVCGQPSVQLEAPCPSCAQALTFVDEGFATCNGCGREVEPEELASLIEDGEPGTKHYFEGGLPGHCIGCDGIRTVVLHDNERLCASCFSFYDAESMSQCAWCGEVNAGRLQDSFLTGCVVCNGRLGSSID